MVRRAAEKAGIEGLDEFLTGPTAIATYTRPSCEGNEPTVLTSSAVITLPSITPDLISNAS
jgi:hypothetical protein